MPSAAAGANGHTLTLVFELSAMEAFANPRAVFADARQWSQYVGVVANDTDAVAAYLAEHDLQQDFDLGERDKWAAMADIRKTTPTDRHVFVGTSADDRRLAAHVGWEFIPYTEAAEKAGWALTEESDATTGLVKRLRAYLTQRTLWPFQAS